MRTRRRAVPRLTHLLAVGLMAGISVNAVMGDAVPGTARAANAAAQSGSWTVYHGDAAGSGASGAVTAVDTSSAAWTSPVLDGQLYGEPLVSSGDVFVATENDTVYALSTSTGRVVWSNHIASPVPASALPCGDISPTVGITGTPVIDPLRNELFVVADELANGHPVHKLVGLDLSSGARRQRGGVPATHGFDARCPSGGVRHGRQLRRLRHVPGYRGRRQGVRRHADVFHRRRGNR